MMTMMMKMSSLWPMVHWEQQGISQVSRTTLMQRSTTMRPKK